MTPEQLAVFCQFLPFGRVMKQIQFLKTIVLVSFSGDEASLYQYSGDVYEGKLKADEFLP